MSFPEFGPSRFQDLRAVGTLRSGHKPRMNFAWQ